MTNGDVQDLLLGGATGQNVRPLGVGALPLDVLQVVQHFLQHRLGLPLDFRQQGFFRAHARKNGRSAFVCNSALTVE